MAEDMSNVDTAWLRMELPNNLMMITGVFIFEQPLDFERFKTTLEQRFLCFERFRQRVVEPRLGLGVSIFSYNDHVWLGVATDQGLAPDPETIVAYYQEEIAQLYALTEQVAEASQKPVTAAPSPAEAPEAAPTSTNGDDLTRLAGIGPAFAGKLRAGGVATYAALAASTPDALDAIVQAPDWRRPDYASWIDQAHALAG